MKLPVWTVLLGLTSLSGCGVVLSREERATEESGSLPAAPGEEGAEGRDQVVLNPRAFSGEDRGLWDGRPSFGGVWVAIPTAELPERVLIENLENGQSVLGAMFQREIYFDGPPIQVSSEAARALGMLAGQPAKLKVTAVESKSGEDKEGE